VATDEARIEFLEIPLGRRGGQNIAGIDIEMFEQRRKLVHECDVEIALGILDDLGGFSDLDRRSAVNAGFYHRAIHIGDDAQRSLVLARYDLGDGFEAMLLVAGIDALRRIADGEIRPAAQTRSALKQWHALLFDRAGIDG
jgi:hypothetical protein